MAVYYKKVDAVQLLLTGEELESLKGGRKFFFEGVPVRYMGGVSYCAILRQGENQVKVQATQWVVRHPVNLWEVVWPEEFASHFIAAPTETMMVSSDPFNHKSFNQPTVAL